MDLGRLFGPNGAMAEVIPAYEPRQSQLEMAEAVQLALKKKKVALIEAPTGTGKSLAYLLPALMHGKRIVVATANKSLQHQLYAKDIPLAGQILGRTIDAVVVKGRQSYICNWKWDRERIERQMLSSIDGEDEQVIQLTEWLKTSDSGDVESLPFVLKPDLRPRVVSFGDDCLHQACAYAADDCFVNKMRDSAISAEILITNHHLLLTALQLGQQGEGILPPASVYIVDEAHHLIDTATAVFEAEVSDHALEALLSRAVYKEHIDPQELEELRFEARIAFDEIVQMQRKASHESGAFRLSEDLPKLQKLARELKALAQAMQDQNPYRNKQAGLDGLELGDGDWPLDEAPGKKKNTRSAKPKAGQDINSVMDDKAKEQVFSLAISNLTSLAEKLAAVSTSRRDDRMVRYAEPVFGRKRVRMMVHAAPIEPAVQLQQHLFGLEKKSIICTSATLADGADFEHLGQRLGLSDDQICSTLVAPTVFDYPQQALLYQPPLPAYRWQARDAFYEKVALEIERLIEISRGRALCLFTSWSGLQRTHQELVDSPWPLRAQGEAPRDALLEWFKTTPNSVLLATRSFWEGVDIAGEALSLVVMDKLPFPAPQDPLHRARMERIEAEEGNSFADYTLPLMTLTLKQGFGRLIRRSADTGVIAILDERLTSKRYGQQVRAILPPAAFSRRFSDVQRFYAQKDALGKGALPEASFALNISAMDLDNATLSELFERAEGHENASSDLPPVLKNIDPDQTLQDANRAVFWRWQLRRLQDGKADLAEGISEDLPDAVSGEFYAAIMGLRNLRQRVEGAGRNCEEFGVEIRCSAAAAGWIESIESISEDAIGRKHGLKPSDLREEFKQWKAVQVLGLERG